MKLTDLDYEYVSDELRAEFDGVIIGGFYVTSMVTYEVIIDEPEDVRVGLMSNQLHYERFKFHFFTIRSEANEIIYFEDEITNKIKSIIIWELKNQKLD